MSHSTVLRLAALAGAFVFLAGCQTPATYRPQSGAGDTGYSDQQLTNNRYRVSFRGNSSTRRDTVENFLLLRSAEITRKAGYHYFMFATRDTKSKTTYRSDFVGWPGWGGWGWYWHSWPYYGPPNSVEARPVTRYEAYAEIVLLTDAQAKNEPRAISAQQIIDHLGALARPAKP